ncbi:sensor histidine kinase [Aquincola sp. S2]|uniref:histidine kinase n=1 Tax=Pseudaquabacterium terrae TaxID=2732868 RepID=A0ABX2EGN5_9BURK|nr:sensor histidine kinase [Aquabacterium terrae]
MSLMLAGGLAAFRWSEQAGYRALADAAVQQLELYSAGLDIEIARHESIPSIMALDEDLLALLGTPRNAELQGRVNKRLTNLNVRAGSLSLFVLDPAGRVLATSNWYEPDSTMGSDLSKTSLFTEAMQGGQSRSFIASSDRGAPEYHFVHVIRQQGLISGLAAVKTSLEAIESMWTALAAVSPSDRLLVVDENDVVIMSSVRAWKFKSANPLAPERSIGPFESSKYPTQAIEPLDIQPVRALEHGTQLVQLASADAESSTGLYVAQERAMPRSGWRLITLSDASGVRSQARGSAVGGAAVAGLAGVLVLYLRQRRRAIASQQSARLALQEANDALELRVEERTSELHRANEALVVEVAERRRTEEQLRAAQGDLIQAGKLSTLGQMSAGITHEINQPLTALRALSENTCQLLAIGRTADVERNLHTIAALTERIGRITAQLKSFAWKASVPADPIPVAATVSSALEMLRNRLEGTQVEVHVDVPKRAWVACDPYRLEQVLLNLMSNALDAMKQTPVKVLHVEGRIDGERIHLQVSDTGCGMSEAVMQRLFEPFFSTKSPGEGLGLGLVISSSIVREFGGVLRARTGTSGTVFEFDLTRVEVKDHA